MDKGISFPLNDCAIESPHNTRRLKMYRAMRNRVKQNKRDLCVQIIIIVGDTKERKQHER